MEANRKQGIVGSNPIFEILRQEKAKQIEKKIILEKKFKSTAIVEDLDDPEIGDELEISDEEFI